jgi:galactose oxidase-like protein/HYR domain-containing protein
LPVSLRASRQSEVSVNRFNPKRFLHACAIAAALTLAATTWPVHVSAAVTTPNWVQDHPNQSPPGRTYAAMSYDSTRARTVLFGGASNPSSNFSDTWEWDGATWTQRTPAASPPALVGAAMAYDAGLNRAILFGGATSSGVIKSDTWAWDGTTWTLMSPTTSPPARLWHAMVYDAKRDRVVLFGGNGGSGGVLGDTWAFDGTTWTKLAPTTFPSARFGESMAFDSNRNLVVLFGGRDANGQRVADTWEWDGTSWTQRIPSAAPYARFWHSMAFDAQLGTTVIFGGDHIRPGALGPINDTWEWDGTQWTQDLTAAAPSPRVGQSMVYDLNKRRIVLFGGDSEIAPDTFYNDTWELVASDTDLGLTGLPANITVPATSSTGAVVTYTAPTAVDEAGDSPAATVSCAPASGSAFAIGTTTVTCMASDADDTPSTVSQGFTVTVMDTDLALTGMPANITVPASDSSGAVVTYTGPTAVDEAGDSPVATVSCAPASGSTFAIGTTTVTCTASDADDTPSTVSQSFSVTVLDTDLAFTGMPGNITIPATDSSGAVVTYKAPTAVDESGDSPAATVSCAPASGANFSIGTASVTCTASDADDTPSSVSQSFTVTVLDTDLALAGVPANITVPASSSSGAVVTYTAPTAVDESGDSSVATVSCAPASGSTFAIGSTIVTCTASDTDDTPSNVSQSFTIMVLDTDLALTGMPSNITVPATNSSGAVVTYTAPAAVDEAGDSPAATVSCAQASGSTFAIGSTTVTCSGSDADDTPSTVSQSFTITVLDTDLAIAGMPANITVPASGPGGAVVTYTAPTAVDESGDSPAATMSCTPASGSTFAIGTTTVTCAASDADDTPSTVSQGFTVTVLDTDLALTGVPGNVTVNATSGSGAVVTYKAPTAVDETGDGSAPNVSCVPMSGSTFAVGTITVTCTATSSDDSPPAVSAKFTVTVLVDLRLALSVTPSTAKTGTVVTGSISLTNNGSVSRAVTAVAKFNFVSSTGQTTTLKTSKVTITLAARQTVTRSFTFKISSEFARGTYVFSVTASDVTGAVSSSASFKVT